MTLYIDPAHILWDTFDALEEVRPEWLDQTDYWEQYTRAFFRSNGLDYDAGDSNVVNWLSATDRAPFAAMADALLDRLAQRADLSQVDFVLLAHWMPDLHLGTSVTNFVMHKLQLEGCFGFAISDHGLSAPFFALDCMSKYLRNGRQRGLLLIMDQKHLLYRSDIVDKYQPVNSACVISIDTRVSEGLQFCGYARAPLAGRSVDLALADIMQELALRPDDASLIADAALLRTLEQKDGGYRVAAEADTQMLCTAPFACLTEVARPGETYVLLTREDSFLSAVAFRYGDA